MKGKNTGQYTLEDNTAASLFKSIILTQKTILRKVKKRYILEGQCIDLLQGEVCTRF